MTIYINITLAILCGWFAGYGFGLKRATKDYRKAIDQACADYREATRIIQKLRNRLAARRFILLKQHTQRTGADTDGTV